MIAALATAQTRERQRSSSSAFHQVVTWNAGSDPVPWQAWVSAPNGSSRYRLSLVPLWAVEGGIVAIEVSVTDEKEPRTNLLGERDDKPQPFVITVEELEAGISNSTFGATRVFAVGGSKLKGHIRNSRLGRGVGNCSACDNIQALTVEFTLK